MEYQYFNPNPDGMIIGDCTIRAGVVASGYPYDYVKYKLQGHKNVLIIDGYNALGGITVGIPRTPVQVICSFCERYPEYNYIMIMDHHCAGIRKNILYDLFDCRVKNREVSYLTIFRATPDDVETIIKPQLEKIIFDYNCEKAFEKLKQEAN